MSKYKIFDNKYLNKLTKILAIPLFWVCLILTKSPIWLVFCLLLTGIYFAKNIIAFIIKHFIKFSIAFVLICACIMLFLSKINTSDTYLNRIYVALQTFKNFEIFIFAEPSLATRVLSYYYTFKVFLANCILGVGLGNAKYYTLTQILNHPMPLTYEFHSRLNNILILRESKMGLNGSLFFDILSDTGIIGFVLFYYFLIKNYLWEKKLKLYYTGIYYLFLDGISKGTLAYIFISIYDINYLTLFIWFFFGMGLIFYPINNKNKLS